MMIQLTMVLVPTVATDHPIGRVDAYTYIVKAAQLRSCPFQDCRALDDLRDQLTPVADPALNWQRNRDFHRILYIYQPLQSVAVNLLAWAGGGLDQGYRLFTIVGEIFVVLAVVVFMMAMFGRGPGGLGLILLSTMVFPGYHGLHWVVPANVTLAMALLLWTAILCGRARPLGMAVAVALMVGLHPIGQIYGATAIFLYLLSAGWRRPATWRAIVPVVVVLLAYNLLPYVVDRPTLSFWKHPPPADWSWWAGLGENMSTAWGMVQNWAARFGGVEIVFGLVFAGAAAVPGTRRKRVLLIGLAAVGLTGLAVGYVLPRYPAEIFTRVWIVAVLVASGLIGQAAWLWLGTLRSAAAPPSGGIFARRLAGTWMIGLALAYAVGAIVVIGFPAIRAQAEDLFRSANVLLDPTQPERVLEVVGDRGRLIYMYELGLYYYLSHGALMHHALDYPAVAGSDDERELLSRYDGAQYVVATVDPSTSVHQQKLTGKVAAALSRHAAAGRAFQARIGMSARQSLTMIAVELKDWDVVSFKINNLGPEAELHLDLLDSNSGIGAQVAAVLPSGAFGWVEFKLSEPVSTDRIVLRTGDRPDTRLFVQGFDGRHRDLGVGTNWPWDQGFTVEYVDPNLADKLFAFDSVALVPMPCRPRRVIDDQGVNIVVEVICSGTAGQESVP